MLACWSDALPKSLPAAGLNKLTLLSIMDILCCCFKVVVSLVSIVYHKYIGVGYDTLAGELLKGDAGGQDEVAVELPGLVEPVRGQVAGPGLVSVQEGRRFAKSHRVRIGLRTHLHTLTVLWSKTQSSKNLTLECGTLLFGK